MSLVTRLSLLIFVKLTEAKEDKPNFSTELPNESTSVVSNIRTKENEAAVAHLLQSEKRSKQNFDRNIQENKLTSKTYKTGFHQESIKNNSLSVSYVIKDDKQSSNEISKTDKCGDLSFLTNLKNKTSNQPCVQDEVEISQRDLLFDKSTDVTIGCKTFACKSAHTNHDIRKTATVNSAHNLLHQNQATSSLKTKSELLSEPQKAVVIPMQGGEPHPSVAGDEKEISELKPVQKVSKQQSFFETISIQSESPVITKNEQKMDTKSISVSKQSTSNLVGSSQPEKPLESIVNEKAYQSTFSGYPPSLFYGSYPFSASLISSDGYSANAYSQAHQFNFVKSMVKVSQQNSSVSKHTLNQQVNEKSKMTTEPVVEQLECKQTQNTDKLEQPSVSRSRSQSANYDHAKQKDASCHYPVKPNSKHCLLSQSQFQKSADNQKMKQLKSLTCSKSSTVSIKVNLLFHLQYCL